MASGDGIGRVLNVVYTATGVDIPLSKAGAVTFLSFLDAGTHTLTFTQTDSTGVNSEIDLNLFTISGVDGSNGVSRIYVTPNAGGTWTEVTSSASSDNVADGADGTNDCYAVTVRADQLSDGYDQVQCTASSGVVTAIVHDLDVQRTPANLQSSIVA